MMTLKPCHAYYYGGLPVKGSRRKGRMRIEENKFHFVVPARKENDRIDLEVPVSRMEKIVLTRDNYYGADTVIFNLTFRDQTNQPFTLRFAPTFFIPRRRIAYQKLWYDYLAKAISSLGSASPLPTK